MLEEQVEDNLRLDVLFHVDNDTHTVAVGFVAQVGNALNSFIADELGDFFDKASLVDLVRKFGDDDTFSAVSAFFDGGSCAHFNGAASGVVRLDNTFVADNFGGGREVGPLNFFHELIDAGIGIVD